MRCKHMVVEQWSKGYNTRGEEAFQIIVRHSSGETKNEYSRMKKAVKKTATRL